MRPVRPRTGTATRDPEMHQTKKGNQYYFGAKAHIGADDELGVRLQKAINNPMAQKRKYAVLERLPDDLPEDWAQILEQLESTDNVTVAHRDDGSVQVFWTVVKDD